MADQNGYANCHFPDHNVLTRQGAMPNSTCKCLKGTAHRCP